MATSVFTKDAAALITTPSPRFVFASGQIPLLPSGELLQATVAEETAQVLRNVSAVLAAAQTDLSRVVKVTIFLTSMADFGEVNGEYSKWFNAQEKPARSCIEVRALPKGARVEIEVVALA
ncbi:uncharacterized protein HMPREF1541_10243 [Cyphellophora europaea CBS 101466]|uniref:Uncharacterized protein n=1 Tax=Cyphellophora europaea (strain CBS 101466) TaxID=1220924 RepID=W2S968_CYPE1|nr:uncharacterized protein HMPREF1541_10243 [Cyphellophora europaea CBS 101466]ETN44573.1 hypothetical protein HMPREF1541_10243 [Cyphellophora europaea CBS 101466]